MVLRNEKLEIRIAALERCIESWKKNELLWIEESTAARKRIADLEGALSAAKMLLQDAVSGPTADGDGWALAVGSLLKDAPDASGATAPNSTPPLICIICGGPVSIHTARLIETEDGIEGHSHDGCAPGQPKGDSDGR